MTSATANRAFSSAGKKQIKTPFTQVHGVLKIESTTVRFKARDTINGLTKRTADKAAHDMGLSLNAFLNLAALQLAQKFYRDYPVPDTEVTPEGIAFMQKRAGKLPQGGTTLFNLLDK